MFSYLALGDSYTIGEGLPAADNFPNQTARLLTARGLDVGTPVVIATTGWTTDELAVAIHERAIQETFSVVSLLIGVNNQYRGRTIMNYRDEFLRLLQQAVQFAGGVTERVVVLSIPDWSRTPFASTAEAGQRNPIKVAEEIDAYNEIARRLSTAAGCGWIDITPSTREHAQLPDYLVADGLHPSAKEYALWAERLATEFARVLRA